MLSTLSHPFLFICGVFDTLLKHGKIVNVWGISELYFWSMTRVRVQYHFKEVLYAINEWRGSLFLVVVGFTIVLVLKVLGHLKGAA